MSRGGGEQLSCPSLLSGQLMPAAWRDAADAAQVHPASRTALSQGCEPAVCLPGHRHTCCPAATTSHCPPAPPHRWPQNLKTAPSIDAEEAALRKQREMLEALREALLLTSRSVRAPVHPSPAYSRQPSSPRCISDSPPFPGHRTLPLHCARAGQERGWAGWGQAVPYHTFIMRT